MGKTFHPFVEFDDPREAIDVPPFSRAEPEALDLTDFVPLTHGKDYEFHAAVTAFRGRGLPPFCSTLVSKKLAEFFDPNDPAIGWLYLDEMLAAMQAANLDESSISVELVLLIDMLRSLERTLGVRRARLVFAFD